MLIGLRRMAVLLVGILPFLNWSLRQDKDSHLPGRRADPARPVPPGGRRLTGAMSFNSLRRTIANRRTTRFEPSTAEPQSSSFHRPEAFRALEARTVVAALWHSTSRFVATTDAASQHTRESGTYEVTDTRVLRLTVPNYVQNALGRFRRRGWWDGHGTAIVARISSVHTDVQRRHTCSRRWTLSLVRSSVRTSSVVWSHVDDASGPLQYGTTCRSVGSKLCAADPSRARRRE